ncbi:major facilitator superfamily domain-containing protein [Microdochium bolleyi]|uniref:Major facilitator superfamily domain-containing protein n=1 Tax=Microdochium bolleyi TaxID=196109 RepID=A0A136JH20_9PEZI|nr:major facilitator superfamily domain-containing protein [Microdochium bolleyi]
MSTTSSKPADPNSQQAGHARLSQVTTPSISSAGGAGTSHEALATPGLADLVRSISERDAQEAYETRAADRGLSAGTGLQVDHHHDGSDNGGGTSSGNETMDEKAVVSWDIDDPENPYNFSTLLASKTKKVAILITCMLCIINSTMGSSLPSLAIPNIAADFGVTGQAQLVLPISVFLIGFVFGPLLWGPLTEYVGRRPVTCTTFTLFMISTMACALAPNWPALLVFRFFVGIFASAPIPAVSGVMADMYGDPLTRGRAMAWFMATTVFGPLFAPVISGFCGPTIGWRWVFWIGLAYAGLTAVPIYLIPETYGPVLLTRRARKLRKENPGAEVYSATELEMRDYKELITVVLTRPVRMLVTEPIVTATCLYLSLVYSIFYMSFQAFPLIFQQVYALSPGVTGLCFMPIGAGALTSIPIFMFYDGFLARARARHASWTHREESRRLPLAFLGGPLFVVSLFWLGWSANPRVHFAVPMLAGLPFGCGFMLIFMALLNYLTDAYEVYAASANAAASSARSIFAVVLPLATTPMFARLGISGACSLLGGLSALMCVIPYVFVWKGESLRSRSKFCIALKKQKEELERKEERRRQRRQMSESSHVGTEAQNSNDGQTTSAAKCEGPVATTSSGQRDEKS